MSDDLDLALGLQSGFGRPKKKTTPQTPTPAVTAAVLVKKSGAASTETTSAPPVSAKLAPEPVELGQTQPAFETSAVPFDTGYTVPSQGPSDRQQRRRDLNSNDSRYGKLVTLRVPARLYEDLEAKIEDLGARSVGQLLVAILKIALGDSAMLGPVNSDLLAGAQFGTSAADRLRASFAQKTRAEASRQMSLRLDMSTLAKLNAAAKAVKAKARSPFILAVIERQLRVL